MQRKIIHKVFIGIVFAMLLIPSVVMFSGLERTYSNNENRKLQEFPEFELAYPVQFIRGFKLYFNDNFGFRIAFFNLYKTLLKQLFDEDPLPRKVVSGKNNWYFLGDENNDVVSETIGAIQFSAAELEDIASKIAGAKSWCEKNGIQFVAAVAPNKHTIYSEYLPFTIYNKNTKLAALKNYLEEKYDFELIDLKETIFKSKDSVQLYYKNDSHWNEYGAYLGYLQLMKCVSAKLPLIKTLSHSAIQVDSMYKESGDLVHMLNIPAGEYVPTIKFVHPENSLPVAKQISIPFHYNGNVNLYEDRYKKRNTPYKVLIFGDSFAQNLKKFLNESFGECVYIWDYKFDTEVIQNEKPDMVILEVVERKLEKLNKM